MDVSLGKEVRLSPEMDSRLERKATHLFCSVQGSSLVIKVYVLSSVFELHAFVPLSFVYPSITTASTYD
ncbi:hypothetical protein TNCV_169001 [Trichonephila clavipes]|nr:hypothetical protein TNCV_169001 [Trichonephila clavipes]